MRLFSWFFDKKKIQVTLPMFSSSGMEEVGMEKSNECKSQTRPNSDKRTANDKGIHREVGPGESLGIT